MTCTQTQNNKHGERYSPDQMYSITESGQWKLGKGKGPHYAYIVELAKSGKARCRKCSEMIAKSEIRFGIPIRDPRGEYGYISAWQHLKCSRVESPDQVPNEVYGFHTLTLAQQTAVTETITRRDAPEHLAALNPEDLVKRGKQPLADPPAALLQHLMPFQREGIWWMIEQERSELKGGILADEMGMGKTIQTIGLILSRERPGPTLVVCPVSSVMQWEEEIRSHVTHGTLQTVTISKSAKLVREDLEAADVVLITYPLLEYSWRNLVTATKVPCAYCGGLFLPRRLRVHNKYYCGPAAKRTAKQMKQEKKSHKQQSKAVIKKGLRTLHVDVDDDSDGSVEETDRKPAASAVGPIGLYHELMAEAGRKVLSRWDRKRTRSSSSSSSDSSTKDGGESSDSGDEEEDEADEVEEKDPNRFVCPQCSFPLLRFPFCPKTGQHHVLGDLLLEVEDDTGGDQVDLTKSVLHNIRWFRVVLDEAHRIKSRTTSTTKAACALKAEHKWALTGTPLQNRVGDLYSLLRFMKYAPYARYFCGTEGCSCSSLSHPFSGTNLRSCIFCGHGPIQHYSYFNKFIMNPITRYGYVGDGRQAMMLLSRDVLHKVMLRRTKEERLDELSIPKCHLTVKKVTLSPAERDFYEGLYKKSTAKFDTFVTKGTILHNYAHIFQLLSRLRQALDHPYLVTQNMPRDGNGAEENGSFGVCSICQEAADRTNVQIHPCRHSFHRACLKQFVDSSPESSDYKCPSCFVRVNIDLRLLEEQADEEELEVALPPDLDDDLDNNNEPQQGKDQQDAPDQDKALEDKAQAKLKKAIAAGSTGILNRIDLTKPLTGTKLDAVADHVCSLPNDEKAIIFSQFGAMLDLAAYWIQKRGVQCVKLVGSMSLAQRQAALQVFRHSPVVRVILISLKAGGEGLNLQHANHVILIDPWWNPAVEMQAIQRAHRIGQSREVHGVRFVTENSVEERMLALQEKKMLVFEGTIDGKLTSLQRLTEEDLQFLFTR